MERDDDRLACGAAEFHVAASLTHLAESNFARARTVARPDTIGRLGLTPGCQLVRCRRLDVVQEGWSSK
jgi:hypothetical protein